MRAEAPGRYAQVQARVGRPAWILGGVLAAEVCRGLRHRRCK